MDFLCCFARLHYLCHGLTTLDMRKHIIILAASAFLLTACDDSGSKEAQAMLDNICTLRDNGHYAEALDSIKSLRQRFPKAIKQREQALEIWQDASLRLARQDIAVTDSALMAVEKQMANATDIAIRNMLGVRRDSLKIRYEALCGTVRVILKRQQEGK